MNLTLIDRRLPFEADETPRPSLLARAIVLLRGEEAPEALQRSAADLSVTARAAGRSGQPLYVLRGIEKSFPGGVQALHGIDLDIREGEIFGIIGRSGAGKSTLLRVLNLLERPTEGSVEFDGRDLLALSAPELRTVRRRIDMIFQHFNLLSSRTVA